MKIFKYVCSSMIVFALLLCTFSFTVNASENSVYIDNEYLNYVVEEEDNEKNVYVYNSSGEVKSHLIFKDDIVLEEDKEGNFNIVAYIEKFEPQQIQTRAIEPTWGGMLSERVRVTFPNPESSAASVITGIIIGALSPGAGIAYTVAAGIAEYVMAYNQRYIDQTSYYRAAAGCPQYRWYDRYEYRNQNGSLFKTVPLNKKSFIGVTHSPQNPPACSLYGF
jgi:hypothetical protein